MKREDWFFAAFLCGIYLILGFVIHGELTKPDVMYCVGLGVGSLVSARRVHNLYKPEQEGDV